jgi:phosphoglycolate phosphatase-like HAD superfamily hydrolase
LKVRGNKAYFKPAALDTIKDISGVIFDCDGVLIDATRSYSRSVGLTVSYLMGEIFGREFPSSFVSPKLIHAIRKSGGFNNDWNTTYVILLKLLSRLPYSLSEKYFERFEAATKRFSTDLYARLDHVAYESVENKIPSGFFNSLTKSSNILLAFAAGLDEKGVKTAERLVIGGTSSKSKKMLRSFKSFLPYPSTVGKGILNTVFDEFFYTPSLFRKVHGVNPKLRLSAKGNRGAIKNENLLVTEKTLQMLSAKVGNQGIGIASGRGSVATLYTLRSLMKYLNSKAMVFLEDIDAEKLAKRNLGKPYPYALLRAAQSLPNNSSVLYVGDSVEDLLMANNAKRQRPKKSRFLFAGVYGTSHSPAESRSIFQEGGADMILKSVNDLPLLVGDSN